MRNQGGSAPKFLDTRRSRESSIRKGKCGWKLLYEEVLTGRVGPKNLGQILEKVQNGLKRLAKISKKSENLFKFPPCFARISPNIDLINLKPFPIDFYGQFASKWDPVSKIPFLLPPCEEPGNVTRHDVEVTRVWGQSKSIDNDDQGKFELI